MRTGLEQKRTEVLAVCYANLTAAIMRGWEHPEREIVQAKGISPLEAARTALMIREPFEAELHKRGIPLPGG